MNFIDQDAEAGSSDKSNATIYIEYKDNENDSRILNRSVETDNDAEIKSNSEREAKDEVEGVVEVDAARGADDVDSRLTRAVDDTTVCLNLSPEHWSVYGDYQATMIFLVRSPEARRIVTYFNDSDVLKSDYSLKHA